MAQNWEERSLQLGHRSPALVHQPAVHGEGQGEGDSGAALEFWPGTHSLCPLPCPLPHPPLHNLPASAQPVARS